MNKEKTAKNTKIKSKFSLFDGITLFFIILFVLVFVFLLLWGLSTSLKNEFLDYKEGNVLGFPKQIYFQNYIDLMANYSIKIPQRSDRILFGELLWNTIVYALGGAFVSAACPCLVAYVVAKFDKWQISKILYGTVVVTMAIPIIGNLSASVAVAQAVGVHDSLLGNMVQKFNFLGFYFLIFHGSFKMLAKDYSEAAYLDGASEWRVFFSIIFPLVRNMFGTVMLIKFVEFWNDYTTVLIYLPSHPTLAYSTFLYTTNAGSSQDTPPVDLPQKMAGAMLLLFPMLIVFTAFNKKLLGNLSMGGVKE